MTKSPLQIARAAYQPKLPASLKGNVVLKEGAATESVADQADIKALFPNTYGMPLISFEPGEKKQYPAVGVGVIPVFHQQQSIAHTQDIHILK